MSELARTTIYDLNGTDSLDTPALIFHEDIIEANTDKVIGMAGGAGRLWPHVKSHKSQHMVRMQQKKGITRFKCATIAEAEMLARCEAPHVLLAYPLAGTSVQRFIRLQLMYPLTSFYAVGDDQGLLEKLSCASISAGITTRVLIDVDMGMNRTGVPIGRLEAFCTAAFSGTGSYTGRKNLSAATAVNRQEAGHAAGHAAKLMAGIHICGFHCYDGNHNDPDIVKRTAAVRECNEKLFKVCDAVQSLLNKYQGSGTGRSISRSSNKCGPADPACNSGKGSTCSPAKPIFVMGGTPSFPCHAQYPSVYLSPGTAFLMDHGYARKYPDLSRMLVPGAILATRVISRPADGMFTLDLGSKGIATDPAGVRGVIAGMEDIVFPVLQSEEHWVFRMADGHAGETPEIGEVLYVIPTHVCPTTAHYSEVSVARGGRIVNTWDVTARNRRITI